MQVQITLHIPDGVAYPSATSSALEMIALDWGEAVRSGVVDFGRGVVVRWESKVTEEF